MRPIRAPQHPIGRGGDERLGIRHGVVIGRARGRAALGPRHLDPEIGAPDQLEQQLERGLHHAFGGLGAAHVVDHDRHGNGADEIGEADEVGAVDQHRHVPAQRRDAVDDAAHHVEIGGAAEMGDEGEAHAAHAAVVQRAEIAVRRPVADQRHAAIAPIAQPDGLEHRGGGRFLRTTLDDDAAFDADLAVQRQELPRRGKRRARPLAKDMAVRIARAGGRREARLFRDRDGIGHVRVLPASGAGRRRRGWRRRRGAPRRRWCACWRNRRWPNRRAGG